MFALLRVTLNLVMLVVTLGLAACSKGGGGGGNPPPPIDPYYSYYPDGRPCEPNVACPGYGPRGEPPPGPGERRGPPYNGDRRREDGRRGPEYTGPAKRDSYKRPPPLPDAKEEEEEKEEKSETPTVVVKIDAKTLPAFDRQAPRSSTGEGPARSRTSWNADGTDGTLNALGGFIIKPVDPLLNPQNETGRDSHINASFTDSKEDEVMTYFRWIMAKLPVEDGYREQSYELAKRINLIDVTMTKPNDKFDYGIKGRTVYLTVEIKDEKNNQGVETKNVRMKFVGSLNGNTHAIMKLQEISDKTYEFGAIVYCIDKSNTCQNSIVELVQYRHGLPCKQAFAVHRFSNFHLRFVDDSLGRYQTGSANPQFMTVMQTMANTVDAKDKVYANQRHLIQSPLFTAQGFKTFSVVNGAAMFNLLFTQSTSYTSGAYNEVLQDKFVIAGPLLPSFDKDLVITSQYKLVSTEELVPDPHRTGLAGKIAHARLLANNGRGALQIGIEYSSTPVEKSVFNVMTLAYDTYDLAQFLNRKDPRDEMDKYFQDAVRPEDTTQATDSSPATPLLVPPVPMTEQGTPAAAPAPAAPVKKVRIKDEINPAHIKADGSLSEEGLRDAKEGEAEAQKRRAELAAAKAAAKKNKVPPPANRE